MHNDLINKYVKKVTKNMGSKQREEVTRELNAHILDSADALAEEKNVPVDDNIIREIILRMGTADELAAMYPEEKANSDNIKDGLRYLAKFTLYFIVVASVIGIVLQLVFQNISINVFLLVCGVVYLVSLVLQVIRAKLFPRLLDR
ncbi:MAG: hypothetical protein F8N15_02570 [Methanobacterium sp.]|nr:hypothetical protein [Methanobacterium sp.]